MSRHGIGVAIGLGSVTTEHAQQAQQEHDRAPWRVTARSVHTTHLL